MLLEGIGMISFSLSAIFKLDSLTNGVSKPGKYSGVSPTAENSETSAGYRADVWCACEIISL